MKKTTFLAAFIIGCLMIVKAGNQDYYIGQRFSIQSEVLDEERNIIVYTPFNYDRRSDNFPVMYLLDGEAHFHHSSGIVEFMSSVGIMPEMIVVAVTNVNRTRDFSPTHVNDRPSTGGAEKFMSFLSDELVPYVEKNFRTHSYKILTGHSFGGEFAAYALLNRPEVFDAYIAISPYLMYDNDFIVKQAKSKIKSNYQKNVMFYMTVGNEPEYYESLASFQKIIGKKSPGNFEFSYIKMEEEDHGSIPHLSIYKGLEWIYSGWRLPVETFNQGLKAVDEHYEVISEKYGYNITVPEHILNQLGYYYLGQQNYDEAIMVFQENVKRFPRSSNVYDSLGEAYEKNNQLTKAAKNYQKALNIAHVTPTPNLFIYEENLVRVQKKLAEK